MRLLPGSGRCKPHLTAYGGCNANHALTDRGLPVGPWLPGNFAVTASASAATVLGFGSALVSFCAIIQSMPSSPRIVTTSYRYKRPPRKRKAITIKVDAIVQPKQAAGSATLAMHANTSRPAITRRAKAGNEDRPDRGSFNTKKSAIVTTTGKKPRKLVPADTGSDAKPAKPTKSPTVSNLPAIVTAHRPKGGASIPGLLPETPEEHRRRGDAADALWRELVCRVREE